MNDVILTKQASDGLVIKQIRFDQVKTRTVIDGKDGFVKTNDITRLGFKTVAEYINHLIEQGYEIKKEV